MKKIFTLGCSRARKLDGGKHREKYQYWMENTKKCFVRLRYNNLRILRLFLLLLLWNVPSIGVLILIDPQPWLMDIV